MKERWIFIGRDVNGWLGFRCIEGPSSIFESDWRGDLYIAPEKFWAVASIQTSIQTVGRAQ